MPRPQGFFTVVEAPGVQYIGAMEIIFEVTQEGDGGLVAECLTEAIFTQADTWEELRLQTRDAVAAFFLDRPAPTAIRLRLVRDEVFIAA